MSPVKSKYTAGGARAAKKQRSLVFPAIIAGVIVIGFVAVMAVSLSSKSDTQLEREQLEQPASVSATGEQLAPFEPGKADPAIGTQAPEVTGTAYDGTPVSIVNDGRPKLVTVVAHWCPHCQRDVADIKDWLEAGNQLPGGIDYYTISTAEKPQAPNYPPQSWLEGWPMPVLRDSPTAQAATAYGLTGTPLWVLIDADGTVVARTSGAIGPEGMVEFVSALSR